jgi:hypothetical protein
LTAPIETYLVPVSRYTFNVIGTDERVVNKARAALLSGILIFAAP